VYRFDQLAEAEQHAGGSWEEVRGLLGGKGANLADMTRLDIPVPPGFTVTTEACLAYLEAGNKLPEGVEDQMNDALATIEGGTFRVFGDPERPLLLSCRSGAKFSMPGMMDTVLNIGLNDETAQGLMMQTDERFVYDSYRRLVQMFGTVVLGLRDELFEDVLQRYRRKRGVSSDAELLAEDLRDIVEEFKSIATQFPTDPRQQLQMAVEAVFASWNGKRAIDYRNAAGISHDLGTAVNVQIMVFGNLGPSSATGVAMTRSGSTGTPGLEGDYLINAQGEDVVSGTRATHPLEELADELPEAHAELTRVAERLESHYREMQDIEFTVEEGKLWLLQTRDGKRTAQAAVRIAVDMAEEGLIDREEALGRVKPAQIDFFLHPQIATEAREAALDAGRLLANGLNVSPGAAHGVIAFDPDLAERWAREGRKVILVRPETKPDDVHGMLAAEGIVTSRGGRTSHAALVARQFGKPAVVGIGELEIDLVGRHATIGQFDLEEGGQLTIDGTTGEVFEGALDTFVPDLSDRWLSTLLSWADDVRRLGVRANADYPVDAERARNYGAEGIGLCRTEHMFFEAERLPIVQRMIMSDATAERRAALDELLPLQQQDFLGLFRAMDGRPVIIRLLDPPLHEFLPAHEEVSDRVTDAKVRLRVAASLEEINTLLARLRDDEIMRDRVDALRESNPMLGLRGVRLAMRYPEIARMQARAVIQAACDAVAEGVTPIPEIMVPLTSHHRELARLRELIEEEARAVLAERDVTLTYLIGTMIETPRAALVADQMAEHAEFFSFGTNDLTQTTFGISRDDAEAGFLVEYLADGVLEHNPFETLDFDGVGALVETATQRGRSTREGLEIGVCGEHGGDPKTIAWCHGTGLDYVSCSPFRVPVARLAAAQAALDDKE
jgi:pyruvate,orthophosphate dikinase